MEVMRYAQYDSLVADIFFKEFPLLMAFLHLGFCVLKNSAIGDFLPAECGAMYVVKVKRKK